MKKRLAIILFFCAAFVLIGYSSNARAQTCDHDWEENYVQPATLSQDGSVEYYCWRCGSTKTEPISRPVRFALSSTTYTYDGDDKCPAVAVWDADGNKISDDEYYVYYDNCYEVGTAEAYIEFDGWHYSGAKTLYYNIVPRSVSIKKLSAQPKGFQVKWNNRDDEEASGFQIQYGTDPSFKNSQISTVKSNWTEVRRIVKLRARTRYYVRMRTYLNVSGKNYYSAWGPAKSVVSKTLKNKKKYCHNLMKKYRGFWLTYCEIINEYPNYYECKASVLTGRRHWTPYRGPVKHTTVRIKKNAKVNYIIWTASGKKRVKKLKLSYYLKHYAPSGDVRIHGRCRHNSKGYIIRFSDFLGL